MIIGLYSPAAQSGKTTVAHYLRERGYTHLPFAQPMRTLGTEWGRECVSPTVWLDVWLAKARRKSFVVVDDVRFENEAELIRLVGGQMWRITRPGVERSTEHASEGGLDSWSKFTCDIVNAGTISDLLNGLPKVPFGPHGSVAPEGGVAGTP